MLLFCTRSTWSTLFLSFLVIIVTLTSGNQGQGDDVGVVYVRRNAVGVNYSSVLILAENRTRRKDPTNEFRFYTGGWNISNKHYWASVTSTAAPIFGVAIAWFVMFGIFLLCICGWYFCCSGEPYGYSRVAYALSLVILVFFTLASIIGCVVLYTGQCEFHRRTSNTLSYIVNQADITVEKLQNVSYYLSAAKETKVASLILPAETLANIDNIQQKINNSAISLATTTHTKSKRIRHRLDSVGIALVVVAAVMLLLSFVGFLCSIFGLQCLVYTMVIIGWILVAGTFILCGVFLLLHEVVTDSCVAMDEWVRYPTAQTALDKVLPCVDDPTSQETLQRSRIITYQIVDVVNTYISNIANRDRQHDIGLPLNFHQSGPSVPFLCNPYNSDYSKRKCTSDEVVFHGAKKVWKSYVCETSAFGECKTMGRLTPDIYNQLVAAVNVSYGLHKYAPFLVELQDCTFVRKTFSDITHYHCPGLKIFSKWVYSGLLTVSSAVMLSLIFWVIYERERRHRIYTKQFAYPFERSSIPWHWQAKC